MAEDHASTTGATTTTTDDAKKVAQTDAKVEDNGQAKTDDIEQIAAKAENPDAVRNAIRAERERAQAAEERAKKADAKIKKYEDASKSEQQRLEDDKAAAEKDAAEARAELLRLRIASRKNLPPELAERLRGENEKELEADADRLLELVKPQPGGDVDAGKGDGAAGGKSMNDLLRGKR